MDALSDVLRAVNLTGAVFLDARFSAPWSLVSEQSEALCAAYLPPSDRVVSFHFITAGECWAMLPDDPAGAVLVKAGEILVVPRGEAHIMGSARDLHPVPAAALMADKVASAAGGVMRLDYGGGGGQVQVVCGFLAVQEVLKNPLLAALPRLFTVDMRGSSSTWLESSLRRRPTVRGRAVRRCWPNCRSCCSSRRSAVMSIRYRRIARAGWAACAIASWRGRCR